MEKGVSKSKLTNNRLRALIDIKALRIQQFLLLKSNQRPPKKRKTLPTVKKEEF
jgi:hypothetical protein